MSNVNIQLIEYDSVNDNELKSKAFYRSESCGKIFEKYVQSIDILPDDSLDIAMIDGRARTACIAHAIPKIRQGGYLIVDNSDRSYYFKGNEILFDPAKWEAAHYIGPVPYTFEFSKTSFFRKK